MQTRLTRHYTPASCIALYFDYRYVLGHDAMKKFLSSRILIVGLGGLGVETAKNLVLGGVHSITLHDKVSTSLADLGSNVL